MSKKSDLISRLVKEVKLRHPVPASPLDGASLVEQGAVLVLLRTLTQKQSEATVEAIRSAYGGDWNEVRVSQVQEIATHIKTSSRKKGKDLLRDLSSTAFALKEYLQDVFQQTHGLDLEFLREDTAAGGKTIAEITTLGMAGGSYLLWLAGEKEVPVHTALIRILDRLGLMTRTASIRKAREAINPLVPDGKVLEFTLAFHEILDFWTDPSEPIFMRVEALRETPAGKKAYQERLAAEKREAERRKKEEIRRIAAEKKEAERRRREEERERKREAAEAARKEREAERRRKALERERERERKRKEAEKKKVAAKKAAERKKAAAEKKKAAEAKKKAAAAAKKKAAAAKKKAAAAKKKATKKKVTKKKATKKPAAKKKAASKKKVTKKKVTKKKPAAKKAAKKKAAKKKVTKKKVTKKKPAAKKKAAKKKAAKKKTVRRR